MLPGSGSLVFMFRVLFLAQVSAPMPHSIRIIQHEHVNR